MAAVNFSAPGLASRLCFCTEQRNSRTLSRTHPHCTSDRQPESLRAEEGTRCPSPAFLASACNKVNIDFLPSRQVVRACITSHCLLFVFVCDLLGRSVWFRFVEFCWHFNRTADAFGRERSEECSRRRMQTSVPSVVSLQTAANDCFKCFTISCRQLQIEYFCTQRKVEEQKMRIISVACAFRTLCITCAATLRWTCCNSYAIQRIECGKETILYGRNFID